MIESNEAISTSCGYPQPIADIYSQEAYNKAYPSYRTDYHRYASLPAPPYPLPETYEGIVVPNSSLVSPPLSSSPLSTSSIKAEDKFIAEKLKDLEKKEEKEEPKKDEESKEKVGKDGKPTVSYIALIATAILQSAQRRLSLGSIYSWIEKKYPYYKDKGQGWRNSVRHNLSLNECFVKAGRCEDGKGNYWAIHPDNLQDFSKSDFRQRRRTRRNRRRLQAEAYIAYPHQVYGQYAETDRYCINDMNLWRSPACRFTQPAYQNENYSWNGSWEQSYYTIPQWSQSSGVQASYQQSSAVQPPVQPSHVMSTPLHRPVDSQTNVYSTMQPYLR